MKSYPFWYRALIFVVVLALFTPVYLSSVRAAPNTAPPEPVATGDPDAPQPRPAGKTPIKPRFPTQLEQEVEGSALDRDWAFYSRRTAGDPNVAFSMQDAATLRAAAADQLGVLGASNRPQKPGAFGGAWTTAGPNPMVLTSRGDRTFDAMTGRIGALAIRSTSPA